VDFGRVYHIVSDDSVVCFNLYYSKLLIWEPAPDTIGKGEFTVIEAEGSSRFYPAAAVNNKIYVVNRHRGLFELADDSLIWLNGLEGTGGLKMFIAPFTESSLLIGSHKKGLFVYDNGRLIPFTTEADQLFKEKGIYTGKKTNDNRWAIGTNQGGFCIIDYSGALLSHFHKDNILKDNEVLCVFPDKQGGLWSTGGTGDIYRTELLSPLSYYDSQVGLEGLVYFVVRFKGTLYAATLNGLYYLDVTTDRFEKIKEITRSPLGYIMNDDRMILWCADGIYQITPEVTKLSGINANAIIPVTPDL